MKFEMKFEEAFDQLGGPYQSSKSNYIKRESQRWIVQYDPKGIHPRKIFYDGTGNLNWDESIPFVPSDEDKNADDWYGGTLGRID